MAVVCFSLSHLYHKNENSKNVFFAGDKSELGHFARQSEQDGH